MRREGPQARSNSLMPAGVAPLVGTALACMLAVLATPAAGAQTPVSPEQRSIESRGLAQGDSINAQDGEGLPLSVARTARFTTDRGTWMSVDVSPDGRTLIFDLLGDLYRLPIGGGQAEQVTQGLAFDAQPRFSPDGSRIVFVSDRSGGENLWIMDPADSGAEPKQVTHGNDYIYTSPTWTPDGEYLVASRTYGLGGAAKIWLFHIEGGSGAQLVPGPDETKMIGADFGPNPRYLWFARSSGGDWDYNAPFPRYQVSVFDRETGNETTMTDRWGSGLRPAISPDGRWLVYGTRHDAQTGLRIRDLDTGDDRWLVYPIQRDDQESRATLDVLPGYAFTPDSREIVISFDGKLWRVPVDTGDPVEIPFTADVALDLAPPIRSQYRVEDDPRVTAQEIRDAVPSPDGRWLAFTALGRLWVMDWPGGGAERATRLDLSEHQPTWSPDGRYIAFVTWSDTEGGHIYRIDTRRREASPVRLTEVPGRYSEPVWSRDGERIVAIRSTAASMIEGRGSGPGPEFVWIPAGGGALTSIAPTGGRSSPHFGPEMDRIYASGGADGLVSFRWDGTDERQHLQVTGATEAGGTEPVNASVIQVSPVGRRAFAVVENVLFAMPLPAFGDEPVQISVLQGEAAFPARRLTDVGALYPVWSPDGRRIHWSLGRAHFVHDVDRTREEGYEAEERQIEVQMDRDRPRGVVALRGARIITMKADEVIENADLLIRDNRIVAVGPRGSFEIPDDADVFDFRGLTIVPGFVDTHAHIRPSGGIHDQQPWAYLANLAYGVTTTRDPSVSVDMLTYGDRVETGEMIGPRIFGTGPSVGGRYRGEAIRDLEHARSIVRRYAEYYGTDSFKMYLAGNRQERQWFAMAAKEYGVMPITEGGLSFKLDLTHAIDGYASVEHNIPIFPIYQDVVRLFVETGMNYSSTLLVSFGAPWAENYWFQQEDPYGDEKLQHFVPNEYVASRARRRSRYARGGWFHPDEYGFEGHAAFIANLIGAGGSASVGAHGQLQGLGYHWELWTVASGGLSEHDALRAATLLGAEAIGLGQDVGSIEEGKLADLVVLEQNPLDNLRNTNTIRHVMKNGRLYDGDTLDEVWPRTRTLPRPFPSDEPPEQRQ